MTTSLTHPRVDFEINALGTLNVLEAVRAHAPECTVIYSSTNKVYGDLELFQYDERATRWHCRDRPDGFDEHTPLSFESPYGCSKGSADQYVLDYARAFGLRTVVFRHSSMYGGRQFATCDQGWIGWFCSEAVRVANGNRAPITIAGSGKQVRDVLHADDMPPLYFSALEHIAEACGQAFNIGGGMKNSLSLIELLAMLEQILGTPFEVTHAAPRPRDQRVFVADLGKAMRILRWSPQVTVEDGVRWMIDWTRESMAKS